MTNIYGVDVRSMVAQQLGGQLATGTLTKMTKGGRSAGSLTGGRSTTATATYTFSGVFDERTEGRMGRVLIRKSGRFVILIGGTLPNGVEPEPGDRIAFNGREYEVLEAESDPTKAVFEALVER